MKRLAIEAFSIAKQSHRPMPCRREQVALQRLPYDGGWRPPTAIRPASEEDPSSTERRVQETEGREEKRQVRKQVRERNVEALMYSDGGSEGRRQCSVQVVETLPEGGPATSDKGHANGYRDGQPRCVVHRRRAVGLVHRRASRPTRRRQRLAQPRVRGAGSGETSLCTPRRNRHVARNGVRSRRRLG